MKLLGGSKPSNSNGSITIREVAAEAGVSTATVSRALAGLDGVAKGARDCVTRAVAKLNYRPNRLARSLRLGHRKVIGVIIPDLQNPFFTGVVHGVEAKLYSAGYTLLLGNSDGLAEREKEQLEIVRGEGAAGLVFIPGNQPGTNYEAIRTWGIPLVAVDRSPGELHVVLVCSSNREGMRQAVSHLLSLGYKDIALLNGPKGISVTQERLGGYQDALRSAGIALRESLIIHSDFRRSGGYAAMARILDMSKRPRAIAVANNLMTLGALQAIHERGVRIPEELAVVCFDDMPWAIFFVRRLPLCRSRPKNLGEPQPNSCWNALESQPPGQASRSANALDCAGFVWRSHPGSGGAARRSRIRGRREPRRREPSPD